MRPPAAVPVDCRRFRVLGHRPRPWSSVSRGARSVSQSRKAYHQPSLRHRRLDLDSTYRAAPVAFTLVDVAGSPQHCCSNRLRRRCKFSARPCAGRCSVENATGKRCRKATPFVIELASALLMVIAPFEPVETLEAERRYENCERVGVNVADELDYHQRRPLNFADTARLQIQ